MLSLGYGTVCCLSLPASLTTLWCPAVALSSPARSCQNFKLSTLSFIALVAIALSPSWFSQTISEHRCVGMSCDCKEVVLAMICMTNMNVDGVVGCCCCPTRCLIIDSSSCFLAALGVTQVVHLVQTVQQVYWRTEKMTNGVQARDGSPRGGGKQNGSPRGGGKQDAAHVTQAVGCTCHQASSATKGHTTVTRYSNQLAFLSHNSNCFNSQVRALLWFPH